MCSRTECVRFRMPRKRGRHESRLQLCTSVRTQLVLSSVRVDEATEAKLIEAADGVEMLVDVAAIKSFLACDCACASEMQRDANSKRRKRT